MSQTFLSYTRLTTGCRRLTYLNSNSHQVKKAIVWRKLVVGSFIIIPTCTYIIVHQWNDSGWTEIFRKIPCSSCVSNPGLSAPVVSAPTAQPISGECSNHSANQWRVLQPLSQPVVSAPTAQPISGECFNHSANQRWVLHPISHETSPLSKETLSDFEKTFTT